MESDTKIVKILDIFSKKENPVEDRVDAAVFLMRDDQRLAEENIIQFLLLSSNESFDFQSEILDVILGVWAGQNKGREAEALFDVLPYKLKCYAELAWGNLSKLEK